MSLKIVLLLPLFVAVVTFCIVTLTKAEDAPPALPEIAVPVEMPEVVVQPEVPAPDFTPAPRPEFIPFSVRQNIQRPKEIQAGPRVRANINDDGVLSLSCPPPSPVVPVNGGATEVD